MGTVDVQGVEEREQVAQPGFALDTRIVGDRPARPAQIQADDAVAGRGDDRGHVAPLPPVLGKAVQQHDRFALADGGDVGMQTGCLDDEVVEAGSLGQWRRPGWSRSGHGDLLHYYVYSRPFRKGVSMPATTRERGLQAAVELLGAEGVRALTHARVDERAGLPPGSTSNWFRTRRALLAGVVDWIAESERTDFDPAAMPAITGVDELIEGLCAMVTVQTGPFAARTRARYALFLELSGDPELGEPLRRQRREFERWTEQLVTAVGIAGPVPATRAIMALCDGLLLHRLTVDPDLDMRPALQRTVRALAES